MFRREGFGRDARLNTLVAGYLAAVAGFVNSAGFVLLGMFTSHVTGNVGRVGVDLANEDWTGASFALLLAVSFFCGAFAASLVIEGTVERTSHAYGYALLLQSLLLAAFVYAESGGGAPLGQNDARAALLCAAMGMQNSLVTRLSGAVVRTTHLTGIVTDLGIEVAGWYRWQPRAFSPACALARPLVSDQAEQAAVGPAADHHARLRVRSFRGQRSDALRATLGHGTTCPRDAGPRHLCVLPARPGPGPSVVGRAASSLMARRMLYGAWRRLTMLKKILVPTDFSESSAAAVRYAEQLALLSKAELVLLHVRDELPYAVSTETGYMPTTDSAQLELELQKLLVAQAESLSRHGIHVTVQQVLGTPAPEILTVAERLHADLIVIGTHGRRGFRRMVLGSVAEHVVRAAKIPVLTVHAREAPLVLPIDATSASAPIT